MNNLKFYVPQCSGALEHAADALKKRGCSLTLQPDDSVTHLLLGVPSFSDDGTLKSGGDVQTILAALPSGITVMGGNLNHPALEGYATVDLLRDSEYLAENARITAHCAVRLALERIPIIIYRQPVLVVGWGRIGKCLAQLLRGMGARVTVAARKASDRAILSALGYDVMDTNTTGYELVRFSVIFNTVPEMVFDRDALQYCDSECLKIDLASRPGLGGDDILWARGLPGKMTPKNSGELIAKTVLRLR